MKFKKDSLKMPVSYENALTSFQSITGERREEIAKAQELAPQYAAEAEQARQEAIRASEAGSAEDYLAARDRERKADDLRNYYESRIKVLQDVKEDADKVERIFQNLDAADKEIKADFEGEFLDKLFELFGEAEIIISKYGLIRTAQAQARAQLKKEPNTSTFVNLPGILADFERVVTKQLAVGNYRDRVNIEYKPNERPITSEHRAELAQKESSWK